MTTIILDEKYRQLSDIKELILSIDLDNSHDCRIVLEDIWEIVKDYEFCKYINGKTSFETCKLELHYDKERPFSVHKEIPGTPIAHVMNELSEEDVEKAADRMYEAAAQKCSKAVFI